METWLAVLLAITLLVAIAVGIALIALVVRFLRVLRTAEEGISEVLHVLAQLRRSLPAAVEAWTTTTQRLDKTLRELEPSLTATRSFVETLSAMAGHLRTVEERLYRRLIPPLEEVVSLLTGALKAISVFVRVVTNRRSERPAT
jgi:sensor domain CHASE-containing protein